jgi:hypothetical protein
MKASTFLNWKAALVLASVPFVAAWLQGSPSTASDGDTALSDAPSETVTTASTDTSSDTQSTVVSQPSPATVPAGMNLYGGTQEVVKLAQAGLGDEVILAYITNSNARFGVTSDQIIYLNDLGVSGTVVTAMMQHDAAANAMSATANAATTNPPLALTPATAPAPGTDYANPPPPPTDDNGMANPPPDSMDNTDSGAPYPGDGTMADDTDYFYGSLQPYGTWVYLPGYGMCWQPTVCLRDHAWRPYCDRGRWLYSDCGWYWQSDYSWGWAAFHYGRWFCDNNRGWVWRPNRVWGPAWVAWRQSDDHCGWAPLPPAAVFIPGRGFRFHNQAVGASFNFGLPAGLFTFIPIERFCDYAPGRYAATPSEAGRIFSDSRMLNSIAFQGQRVANLGMDPRVVDEMAGERMRRAVIQEIPGTDANGRVQPDRLGRRGGSLVIFRPQLPPAPVRQGTGPAAGGAGATAPRTSFNAAPTMMARTPMVLGTTGFQAGEPATEADGVSRVHVYQVTHEDPKPAGTVSWSTREAPPGVAIHTTTAGTYPPNSMVLEGRRNITNPQWNSTPGQASSGTQYYNYRPSSAASYGVTQGAAGNQQSYGNPYYHSTAVAVATPGSGATYAAPGYGYRQSVYAPAASQESSYRAAPEPRENYSAPEPRESYSAPAQSSSSHSSSYSQSSSSTSSSSSQSSSSSGSSRGR